MFEGRLINVIYLLGNVSDVSKMVVKSEAIGAPWYLCKYFYDVREGESPDDIIERAQSHMMSSGLSPSLTS